MAANILVGRFLFGTTHGYWALSVKGTNGTTPKYLKTFESQISFQAPFTRPPVILFSLNNFQADMFDPGFTPDKQAPPYPKLRYSIEAKNINPATGFTIDIQCWDATRIYWIGGTWIAFAQETIGNLPISEVTETPLVEGP